MEQLNEGGWPLDFAEGCQGGKGTVGSSPRRACRRESVAAGRGCSSRRLRKACAHWEPIKNTPTSRRFTGKGGPPCNDSEDTTGRSKQCDEGRSKQGDRRSGGGKGPSGRVQRASGSRSCATSSTLPNGEREVHGACCGGIGYSPARGRAKR